MHELYSPVLGSMFEVTLSVLRICMGTLVGQAKAVISGRLCSLLRSDTPYSIHIGHPGVSVNYLRGATKYHILFLFLLIYYPCTVSSSVLRTPTPLNTTRRGGNPLHDNQRNDPYSPMINFEIWL